MSEFERGDTQNVTIHQDGTLSIGLQGESLAQLNTPYVWCADTDHNGNIYVGTGNNGKIWKITGKDTLLFFQTNEIAVYCLLCSPGGDIYAGTMPQGKVYKINPKGDGSVILDTGDTYIWDLEMDDRGALYVATGAKARIFKITPKETQTFFQCDQTHVKSLCFEKNGRLYAGTSGNGYIYRFDKNGKAFVLFDTQMEEVHSIVATPRGETFAAVFGEPKPGFPEPRGTDREEDENSSIQANEAADIALAPQAIIPERLAANGEGPTALFKINSSGYAKDLWLGKSGKIYSLGWMENRLIVGTGNDGKLYHVDENEKMTLIYQFDQSQITSIISHNQSLIVGTANMGECFRLGPDQAASGEFTSETLDTGLPVEWGIVSLEGRLTEQLVNVFARSGNTEEPEQSWSPWQPLTRDGDTFPVTCPPARFIQLRCKLERRGDRVPVVEKISISYIQKNLAPQVTDILIHRPGDYYNVSSDNPNNNPDDRNIGLVYPKQLGEAEYKKGYRSVDWLFEDPNFDGLSFDIYYRPKDRKQWFNLASDLFVNVYSWDSAQMQDGRYELKIVASDSVANPFGHKFHEKISDPFDIDNSGPVIENVKFEKNNITFNVRDAGVISAVLYSINAGGWLPCYPEDGLIDSKNESFRIDIKQNGTKTLELAIKAKDKSDNYSVLYTSKGK